MLDLRKLRMRDLLLFRYREVLNNLLKAAGVLFIVQHVSSVKLNITTAVTTKKTFPEMFLYCSATVYRNWHVPFITLT